MSLEVEARTWVTEPGSESASEVETVWIESMTASEGFCFLIVAQMVSMLVSGRNFRLSVLRPKRVRRSLTCWADSSADTYNENC